MILLDFIVDIVSIVIILEQEDLKKVIEVDFVLLDEKLVKVIISLELIIFLENQGIAFNLIDNDSLTINYRKSTLFLED